VAVEPTRRRRWRRPAPAVNAKRGRVRQALTTGHRQCTVAHAWAVTTGVEESQGIGEVPPAEIELGPTCADFGYRLFTEYEQETAGNRGMPLEKITAQMRCRTEKKPVLVRHDENRQKRIRWLRVRRYT